MTTTTSGAKPLLPAARKKRRGEGKSPRRRKLSGRHLARATILLAQEELLAMNPNDFVGPELRDRINSLIMRGGRFCARAPLWNRATPFPETPLPLAATAYVALLKLLDAIDPELVAKAAPPGIPTIATLPRSGRRLTSAVTGAKLDFGDNATVRM